MSAQALALSLAVIAGGACSEQGSGGPSDASRERAPSDWGLTDTAPGGDGSAALCPGDRFAPWAGGPGYYASWKNGPSSSSSSFPIAVWLQAASNAPRYQEIGINLYIGLWKGPTEDQLKGLAPHKMPVFCSQNSTGLSSAHGGLIQAWTHQDEPDNAQAKSGGGYDPCVPPATIQQRYQSMRARDATRPVYLNLGQGVANPLWKGRGVCTGHDEHYPEYIKGADIVSFDIYPVTNSQVTGKLWYVARGVQRLRAWANYNKPVWNWIETTHINSKVRPTPAQVRAEVWMSLIHGAMGIGYFAHEFSPSFKEAGLLAYADVKAEVKRLNQQITSLAPVLNSPSVDNGVSTRSENSAVELATLLKRHGRSSYLFAVAMEDQPTTGTFQLSCVPAGARVEVLGEGRTLTLGGRTLKDSFKGYQVHLYRIAH